jgi:hypothetical protein
MAGSSFRSVKLAEVRREIGLELATSMERVVSTVGIVVITDAFKDDVSHPSWWSLGF